MTQKNEGGVWALLGKADRTAAQKEGEELVYEAMAVSLSEAWKTLVAHLEKRRSLLILACHFFECALEVMWFPIEPAEALKPSETGCRKIAVVV